MARQPIHIEQRGAASNRERIWAAIRRLRTFTAPDIRGETSLSLPTIRDYLKCLEAGGIVERQGMALNDDNHQVMRYALIEDRGIEAPRLRRDGSLVTLGAGREQMWRTMRILQEFDWRELAIAASTEEHPVAEQEASSYVQALHKAGYLQCVRPGKGTGDGGERARYRFIASRWSGPKPPMVQRLKTVYDPNLGKIAWHGPVGGR